MNLSPRRARNVSLGACILSVLFFIFTLIFGQYSDGLATFFLSWHILAGLLVWLVLLVQFYQRGLAEQEKLDMGQLAKAEDQGTIFSGGADRMALMAVQQKRLAFLEKWVVPISGVVIALYQVVMGGWVLMKGYVLNESRLEQDWGDPKYLLLGAALLAAMSFVSFLVSRFATGMSEEREWKPLRAGGSYLLATAILGFALAIALLLKQYKYAWGLTTLNYVIPILIVVLGVETLLNAILDIYRPRVAGQYSRAAFDSRILGLINEPGGILHTVAHTIDYQFGFKVSQTWFYRLLEKAIVPLILFAALVLYLMSCFVIVQPGHAGVLERNGVFLKEISSGLHVKLPWPFEKAYIEPTDQIQEIVIGYEAGEHEQKKKALLWGEKHYEKEYNLLVGVELDPSDQRKDVPPVGIVQANVPVQYCISDVRKFVYKHEDSRQLLESICYRELTRYAASAKIEEETAGTNGQKSLLGGGRAEAAEELHRRIQKAADAEELGIEVVFVGLQGVHPPPEVAKAYEEVIAAIQKKQVMVLEAQAARNRILTELAGSVEQVDTLYDLARAFERSKEQGDEQETEQLRKDLQTAFGQAQGTVFKILREAESYAFERVNLVKGEGLRFAGQVKAYRASPELYKKIQRLLMLEETLNKTRKYIVVADEEDTLIYSVDLLEKLKTSLYQGLGEEQ